MKFEINPNQNELVNITLSLEAFCGCKLPVLYANNVKLLHILPDGRIVIHDKTTTNIPYLESLGFKITTKPLGEIKRLTTIFASDLAQEGR